MNAMFKKILSLILALVMCISVLPLSAFAEEMAEDVSALKPQEAAPQQEEIIPAPEETALAVEATSGTERSRDLCAAEHLRKATPPAVSAPSGEQPADLWASPAQR